MLNVMNKMCPKTLNGQCTRTRLGISKKKKRKSKKKISCWYKGNEREEARCSKAGDELAIVEERSLFQAVRARDHVRIAQQAATDTKYFFLERDSRYLLLAQRARYRPGWIIICIDESERSGDKSRMQAFACTAVAGRVHQSANALETNVSRICDAAPDRINASETLLLQLHSAWRTGEGKSNNPRRSIETTRFTGSKMRYAVSGKLSSNEGWSALVR